MANSEPGQDKSFVRKIGGVLALLGLVLALGAGVAARDDWQQAADLEKAARINLVVQQLVNAAGDLAVERGSTNGVINAPEGSEQSSIDEALSDRENAIKQMDEGLAKLDGLEITGLEPALRTLDERRDRMAALRKDADEVFTTRQVPDNSKLVTLWFAAATNLIMATSEVWQGVQNALPQDLPAEVAAAFEDREALWLVSEFSGRQRGIMAGVIASNRPMTSDELAKLVEYDGVINGGWMTIDNRVPRISPQLGAAVQAAKDVYSGRYAELRTAVYEAGARGGAYPVSSADWFAVATDAIERVRAAGATAADVAADVSATSRDRAESRLWLSIGLVAAALFVVGFGVWFRSRAR